MEKNEILKPEDNGYQKKWSWAGFIFDWIYLLAMEQYLLALLFFILTPTLVPMIIVGMWGRDWAWKKRKWESFDQFQKVQEIWDRWAIIIFWLGAVSSIVFLITGAFFSGR